jgi:hypothetical protein
MKTMKISILAASVIFCMAVGSASATLIGTQVTGALYFLGYPANYFDPTTGRVPAGYLNTAGTTVTIATNAVEFGYSDGAVTVTADFTATQLVVTDHVLLTGAHYNPLQLVFSNTAFSSLATVSDSFPNGGLTSSLSGNVITLNWSGGSLTNGQTLQAIYNVNAPAAPPLSIQLAPPNAVVLSWPWSSTTFRLQHNSSVTSTNWLDLAVTPVLTNGLNQVTVSPAVGTQFFRLIFP